MTRPDDHFRIGHMRGAVEKALRYSEPTRNADPSVPWSAAIRMRDRLTHHAFDVDPT